MSWFRYRTSSGELLGESVNQFVPLGFGRSQIENPTDNRTEVANPPPGKFWIYDGTQLRDATAGEIAGFPAFQDADDELRTRQIAELEVDVVNSIAGKHLRALALVVMDEINILRGQHGLPDRTVAQLKNAVKNKISSGEA